MTEIPFQVEKYEEQTKMKHLVIEEFLQMVTVKKAEAV